VGREALAAAAEMKRLAGADQGDHSCARHPVLRSAYPRTGRASRI